MFGSLLAAIFVVNTVRARTLNVDEITARALVRIDLGTSSCSGTLISSTIVYTAASCLHGRRRSSITVYHHSSPWQYHMVKRVFVPQGYRTGRIYLDTMNSLRIACYEQNCKSDCEKKTVKMWQNYMNLDYGLLLLEGPLQVCVNPTGPVAATLSFPAISGHGKLYVPTLEKTECFTVGYGGTENPYIWSLNMAILEKIDGIDASEKCGPIAKGVYLRFHNSSESKRFRISTCAENSGQSIQCISHGGKRISVLGVHTTLVPKTDNATYTKEPGQRCNNAYDTFAIAGYDHVGELFKQMVEWNELDNYHNTMYNCWNFLQQHPFESLMFHYLRKEPEFNGP